MALERHGHSVYVDYKMLKSGEWLVSSLRKAIEHSRWGLVVWNRKSSLSSWVDLEMSEMIHKEMRIIALQMDPSCPVPRGKADVVIDVHNPDDIESLADAIDGELKNL